MQRLNFLPQVSRISQFCLTDIARLLNFRASFTHVGTWLCISLFALLLNASVIASVEAKTSKEVAENKAQKKPTNAIQSKATKSTKAGKATKASRQTAKGAKGTKVAKQVTQNRGAYRQASYTPGRTTLVRGKNGKMRRVKLAPPPTPDLAADGTPYLLSSAAVVIDQTSNKIIYSKRSNAILPIASITKLMTAMVVLDTQASLDEAVIVSEDDVDLLKNSRSRLVLGTPFRRADLLRLSLMASDNRAASALGRSHVGGTPAFVQAMNQKAIALGMKNTRFVDSSGLNPDNTSTAQDLAKLVVAAGKYQTIRDYTTTPQIYVTFPDNHVEGFLNSNSLVRGGEWTIDVSKTGYIKESGKCLVMRAFLNDKPTIIVLLNSEGQHSRLGDANRIRKWMEGTRVASAS